MFWWNNSAAVTLDDQLCNARSHSGTAAMTYVSTASAEMAPEELAAFLPGFEEVERDPLPQPPKRLGNPTEPYAAEIIKPPEPVHQRR